MWQVEALVGSLRLQHGVVATLRPAELRAPSPCEGWTVRDVLGHSLGVTSKFADFAARLTDAPRTPPGDLVGADHVTATAQIVDRATRAWQHVSADRWCQLPFGEYSAAAAAGINLFDVMAHTWDIASATGRDLDGDDALWTDALTAAEGVIGSDRDPAHYGNARIAPQNATAMEAFLAYLGRDSATAAELPEG